uniref:Uncharacterized protein n=1 Tax=Avena sativa TaxID=4498 RepID=A0ACD5WTD2_AVESA
MGRKAPPLAPTGRKRKGPSFPLPPPCKHRRIPAPAQPTTGWASLPNDIARQVAALVLKYDVVDYIAFRGVCSGWRACAPTPRDPTLSSRSLRPVDWIPLCDGDAVRPDDACQITFFHCKTARSLRVRLPELQRHRIIGFTDGLVILLHKRRTTIHVLHPFTGVVVDFPSLVPVYQQLIRNRNCVLRMTAAVCTSVSSTTSIAVVAWFLWSSVVLSADAGHPSWQVISNDMDLANTLTFQGQLYGFFKSEKQIVQVYPPKPLSPVVARVPQKFGNPFFCSHYLVESDGHMLLVVKSSNLVGRDVEEWRRYVVAIFKVDLSLGPWELIPVSSLGDRALFVSMDRCLSVSSRDLPSISSNSTYLTVPLPNPVVLHSLSSQSFERPTTLCQVHNVKERIRPSVRPFTLADHLLTYCNHREWATGLMFHEYYAIPKSFEELWKRIRTQDSEVRISRVKD